MAADTHGDWAVLAPGFRILVVGRDDTCRSPLAARMLQRGLDGVGAEGFTVFSAGSVAATGRAAALPALELAARRNIRLHGFGASRLESEMVAEADLVLSMDRSIRREVVTLVPQALRATFTLREFARILPTVRPEQGATPSGRWHSLVAIAPRHRMPLQGKAVDDDVLDPRDRGARAYETMMAQISSAVEAIRHWEAQARVPANES